MTPQGKDLSIMCDVLDLIDAQVTDQARPVILMDGRSGAGKTTLAAQLAARHPNWQLVHADDIYPGWTGLSGVWDLTSLWNPEPSYLSWDWYQMCHGSRVSLDAHLPMIVEGAGVLTSANRAHATLGVWCELDAPTRRGRALRRDPKFQAYWAMWAVQEGLHIARNRPAELADLTVDCTTQDGEPAR